MRPVRLVIDGSYWDCQLYSGRLFLFERDGSVGTYDWNGLIETFARDASTRLVAECAFRRSDFLYSSDLELFFQDPDIRSLLTQKFRALSSEPLHVSRRKLQRFRVGEQDSPYPFPHADSTIYRNKMWVVGPDGLFSSLCNRTRRSTPISRRVTKSWDAPIYAASASYGNLALAAGPEGLWEHQIDYIYSFRESDEPEQLTQSECDGCDWMYHSIYGASHDGGFLAEFERSDRARQFTRTVSDQQIFHHRGYSWGTRDKIYMASGHSVDVVRYSPYRGDELTPLGSFQIQEWKGAIVSGGVAPFGAIGEFEHALVIMPSTGRPVTLPGEPVRWRVYPRSTYYQNHLHVIYENHFEVLSFNHDYFVDQETKIFGTIPVVSQRPTYRGFVANG
jgi:hypothetical protein